MKRLILLVALVMAMAVLAPAAFADDEADGGEGADVEMEAKEPSDAQLWKAEMIADYFAELFEKEITDKEVSALRAGGEDGHKIGWGVLYKLMLYGFDPSEYESGWALGELRKMYLESNDPADLHKSNLGQAQKAAKDKPDKPEKVMPSQSNKDKNKHND